MTLVLPTFQPQNPQLSGYSLGWLSCTAYAAAMAGSFDKALLKAMTGEQVRRATGDTSGGLNLAQVDAALREGWGVDLDTRYRLPWADFVKRIDAGQGAILQGHSSVFVGTAFNDGSSVNHAVFVPPGWAAMDPAADGRRPGIYDRRKEAKPYPKDLLRKFAARLILNPATGSRLGDGLVYASFTRDRIVTYKAVVHPTPPATRVAYHLYTVSGGIITHRETRYTTGFTVASVSPPRVYDWPSHPLGPTSVSLVRCNTGSLAGKYLHSKFARTIP